MERYQLSAISLLAEEVAGGIAKAIGVAAPVKRLF